VTGAAIGHAHGGGHGGLAGPVTQEERDAYAAAKPVFEQHCFRCHTTHGKKAKPKSLAHLTMDKYPLGGHHAPEVAAAIRQVLGAGLTKKKATMPSDNAGAVSGEELAKVLAWADAFDRAHPAPKPHADHADAHH
jgi:hypothetical protein